MVLKHCIFKLSALAKHSKGTQRSGPVQSPDPRPIDLTQDSVRFRLITPGIIQFSLFCPCLCNTRCIHTHSSNRGSVANKSPSPFVNVLECVNQSEKRKKNVSVEYRTLMISSDKGNKKRGKIPFGLYTPHLLHTAQHHVDEDNHCRMMSMVRWCPQLFVIQTMANAMSTKIFTAGWCQW